MSNSKCGTNAGYAAHRRSKTDACEPCATAHRDYLRSRRHLYAGKYKDYQRKYAQEHLEQGIARQRKWRTLNPEKYLEASNKYRRARRARLLNVESEPYTSEMVLTTYGDICHICSEGIDLSAPRTVGKPGWENGLHLDHLVPLVVGGTDVLSNIRPAHGKCNLLKPRKTFNLTTN